jgi:type I restriction enzyme, S subunit
VTEEIVNLNSNSAQPGINKASVATLPILLPPAPVVRSFDETVAPMTDKILENAKESGMLAALRDALLPKLLSGELRVIR